jgi:hypothetical protein
MKQFPGLMNTEEGRRRILKMMDTNYKLDELYENALKQVYQHYKLSGISPVDADKLAQDMIEEQADGYINQYLELEEGSEEGAPKLSGRMVDVMGPDGETYELDESEVEALPPGWRLV